MNNIEYSKCKQKIEEQTTNDNERERERERE
jgi:hypothetical protein